MCGRCSPMPGLLLVLGVNNIDDYVFQFTFSDSRIECLGFGFGFQNPKPP